MLNKKDPLIGAVQQVMHKSNVEREATRLVNEAFGIEDRKALPHENQAEWDSAYQQVLSESNIDHPNKRKLDVAEPYGKLTKKDFSTLRAMGEEENFDKAKKMPLLIKKKQKPVQPTPMPNAPLNPKPGAYKLQKLEEDQLDEELLAIQEEIAYNLAEQAEYVYENYGEEGLVEFIDSLTEEQYELLYMNEGIWDYVKDRASKVGSAIGSAAASAGSTLASAGDTALSMINPIYRVGKAIGGAIKKDYDSYEKSKETPKYTGNVKYTQGSADSQRAMSTTGQAAPKPPKPTAKPADLNTTPKVKKKVAPKAAAPKAAAPQPKKKLTFFQKQELRRSEKNDTMDQTRNLERRYGVRAPMKKAKKSIFKEQIADIIAEKAMGAMVAQQQAQQNQPKKPGSPMPISGEKNTSWFSGKTDMQRATKDMGKMDKLRRMQKNPPALGQRNVNLDRPNERSNMAIAQNANIGGAGGGNYQSAQTRIPNAVKRQATGDVAPQRQELDPRKLGRYDRKLEPVKSDLGKPDNMKYKPEPGTLAAKLNQAGRGANPPVVPSNMGGGGGNYPAARANPIKVSDTEVMNDPKFKKALSDVGGTQAAKKVQIGQRVAGLGRMNKDDTIMSRVRTDIAARKNVGRES